MLLQILNTAEKMGVPDTRNPRKLINIMCCVRAAVIVRAILLQFSSNTNIKNPDGKKEYEIIDHIWTQGHLVDTASIIYNQVFNQL